MRKSFAPFLSSKSLGNRERGQAEGPPEGAAFWISPPKTAKARHSMLCVSHATTNRRTNAITYFSSDVCSCATELSYNWPQVSGANTTGTSSSNITFCSFHQLTHLPQKTVVPDALGGSVYRWKDVGKKNMSERSKVLPLKWCQLYSKIFFLTSCDTQMWWCGFHIPTVRSVSRPRKAIPAIISAKAKLRKPMNDCSGFAGRAELSYPPDNTWQSFQLEDVLLTWSSRFRISPKRVRGVVCSKVLFVCLFVFLVLVAHSCPYTV